MTVQVGGREEKEALEFHEAFEMGCRFSWGRKCALGRLTGFVTLLFLLAHFKVDFGFLCKAP